MPLELLPTLWQSIKVTLRVLWRVTRQLFHETTGALFGLFAVFGGFVAWREWKHGSSVMWIMAVAIAYAIMMAAFAFGSFRKARRVR
jgi:hypothetical protein